MTTEMKNTDYSEIYDDNFEIIIEESSDEEETKNIKDLTIYDDEKNKYYIGSQVCELLGYKNTGQTIKINVSDDNKITFKNYSGKKEPSLDPRQILITKEGVYELLQKNKKISQNIIDVFAKANIDVYKIIKNDKEDNDENKHVEGKLTTYSYISNDIFYEYFVGYQITSLIGYKNETQALSNVSKKNKIEFKDYPGLKKPFLDHKTFLIKKEGVYELLQKNKKITQNIIDILIKSNFDVSQIIKDTKDKNDDDDDNHEENKLTTYSYISNGIFFEYFVGYQITSLIGYTNVTQALANVSKQHKIEFRDYPGVRKPMLDPKTILITGDGVVEFLIKTRKRLTPDVLHMLKEFGISTTNRKCLTKEQQTLSAIANAFKTEKIEDQFKIGSYYLDMYFPEYKIVIECDENGHADRKPYTERDRMDYVNKEFDIEDSSWIRFNPDEYDFDLSKVIGRIYSKIIQSKKEKLNQETLKKLEETLEADLKKQIKELKENNNNFLITRRCNMCYDEKSLYENFSKNGSGHRMTCKECFTSTGKEKPVKQYNLDGTFIERFSSVKEAAEKSKLCPSQIARNCRGIVKRAGNYMWVFENKEKKNEESKECVGVEESKEYVGAEESKNEIIMETGLRIVIIDSEEEEESEESEEKDDERIAPVNYESCKMLAQYNINGELIQVYKSVAEACRKIGINKKRSLYGAIKNNFVSYGFVWKYVENDIVIPKIEPVAPFKKYMKPVEIYKDGVLYKIFNCIKDSAKGMNVNVSMCRKFLAGTKKDPKNFEWKFKEKM